MTNKKKYLQMKKYILLFTLPVLFSCGKVKPKGNISMNTLALTDFKEIEGNGKFRVFWVNDPNSRAEIETYPNIFENLKIEVKDGKLKISEKNPVQNVDFYNITLYSKQIPSEISLADSIDFNISGGLKTDHFKLKLKNNAKFIGALNTQKTDVEMKDVSIANIKGFTKKATIKIQDTAGIIAPFWKIQNLKIDAKNHPYAEVNVQDTLSGNLEGTTKMLYYHDPIKTFKRGKGVQLQHKESE